MDAVSHGSLANLTKDADRNSFIPEDNTEASTGLSTLFCSIYWSTALHYLGLRPGMKFPHNSQLHFAVKDRSPALQLAEKLSLFTSEDGPDIIPIESMFGSK